MGSADQILDFQNVLSWTSSGVIRSCCMSLRTQSTHLPLGLSLGLFPGTLMSTTALTSLFSSILCMCPYQRSLISLNFSCILVTPSSLLMSTLFSLSLSVYTVTPLILLNVLISVFSRVYSYFFPTVQHSAISSRSILFLHTCNHFEYTMKNMHSVGHIHPDLRFSPL